MDTIIELTRELVKAKDKEIRFYIMGLIDDRRKIVDAIKEYENLKIRVQNLESKASFSGAKR